MAEHLIRNEKVVGSTPTISSTDSLRLKDLGDFSLEFQYFPAVKICLTLSFIVHRVVSKYSH